MNTMNKKQMSLSVVVYKTYLGNKGYTIYKDGLSHQQLSKIRKDLTVKPFSPLNMGFSANVETATYPIYLEDLQNPKIYVPYFYGVREFGAPKSVKISQGENIPDENAIYRGHTLRDNQKPVIDAYLSHIKDTLNGVVSKPKAGGLFELHTGFGKTLIAINLIAQLKKKTLIIVQKEFLMNQWIENITVAMPQARIGRIQGEIVDIHDKDIVIGMLQSLSMKTYPSSVFESFGFLIVDEVHHISSFVFCRALSKITTTYTLGLSATLERKDKTSWVIKDFLGDVLYKATKRDVDYGVVVRGVQYNSDLSMYDELKRDNRGNPLYSCMISCVCENTRRTEFIIKLLFDTLAENSNQQVMILAHNRSILEYMYNSIRHHSQTTLRDKMYAVLEKRTGQQITAELISMANAMTDSASMREEDEDNIILQLRNIHNKLNNLVGYYLGGMKDIDLKASEKKTIILATYAMASEALDIKTLSTLFLITSKTDIVQSVGRILRAKNTSSPVIYDIIDNHPIFKNQWRKRIAFYKKEQYRIITTTNDKYSPDVSLWSVLSSPNKQDLNGIHYLEEEDGDGGDSNKIFSKCLFTITK